VRRRIFPVILSCPTRYRILACHHLSSGEDVGNGCNILIVLRDDELGGDDGAHMCLGWKIQTRVSQLQRGSVVY
jgi:hypothetical protein